MFLKKKFNFIEKKFRNFLFMFFDEKYDFKYRKQIIISANLGKKIFPVFLNDLSNFDKFLYSLFLQNPFFYLNIFELSLNKLINSITFSKNPNIPIVKDLQIFLIWKKKPSLINQFYHLKTDKPINLRVEILSSSTIRFRIKQKAIFFNGANPENIRFLQKNENEKGKVFQKKSKEENFLVLKKNLVSFQILKAKEILKEQTKINVQFFPLWLILEREMVNLLVPGNQVIVTGIFVGYDGLKEMKINYSRKENVTQKIFFQVLGFFFYRPLNISDIFLKIPFYNPNFIDLVKSRKVYEWIFSCISPDLLGFEEIKKSLACLLFGGNENNSSDQKFSSKPLKILIVGEKLTIKLKFFNFIKKFSEFNSSQLTISNLIESRTSLNEKQIYSSSFLCNEIITGLKDLGIILIENLEELQMIEKLFLYSIGVEKEKLFNNPYKYRNFPKNLSIFAFLKARKFQEDFFRKSSNPSTISAFDFSEFDLIFLLPDKYSEKYDKNFSERTFHSFFHGEEKLNIDEKKNEDEEFRLFKNFINFSRFNFFPKISKKASLLLQNAYLFMRISQKKNFKILKNNFFFISIKKLETMIKISESLSKMRMSNLVYPRDALEAIKIMKECYKKLSKN